MSSHANEPRRPRLLPQNRKLRHLKGLSLRNLCFTPSHLKTSDDGAIKTPSKKLHALNESEQVHHSRSSDNLRKEASLDVAGVSTANLNLNTPAKRPGKLRRTSLSFVHAAPSARQKRLEEVVDDSVGDAFFSLHVRGEPEPVYISEVREHSANFDFRFFELSGQPADVSRSCAVAIRIWARMPKQDAWVYLLEELVDLRRLRFIGTLLDRQFPQNALVFHLEDGVYSLDFPNRIADPKQSPALPTSSYNALMKLANLESSIEDAIATQRKIVGQIDELLSETTPVPADAALEEVLLAQKYVATQRRTNQLAEKRRDDLTAQLASRHAAMQQGRQLQAKAGEDIVNNRENVHTANDLVAKTEQQIHGQRRRICSELNRVFPISPIPNAPPLSFQICGIPLPNSVYDAATARELNEDVLSASLGLVTLLTHHLQFYLSCPLPYPLHPFGSRSLATDAISILTTPRAPHNHHHHRQPSHGPQHIHGQDFPLYLPRGGSVTSHWRFEYAWFLLNKNIEALCSSQGLKVVDIRHTLPNLKYLLYVCEGGRDEVPERKRGGVRGLWAGRMKGRMGDRMPSTASFASLDGESDVGSNGSRRGSVDSEVLNSVGDALRKKLGEEENGAVKREDGEGEGLFSLPFRDDSKLTLRTKGLRENR